MGTRVYLTGVALTAALLLGLVDPQKYFYLAIGVFGLAAPLALCGVVLTFAYPRWPRAWTRYPYLIVLFLILAANVVLVGSRGWRYALVECRDCGGPLAWWVVLLPGSLFIVIAPLVKGLTVRLPAR